MPPRTKTKACSQCRRKKVLCGREEPSCEACQKTSVDCDYPTTTARYGVSRVRSCIACRRQRARCDRKNPCSSCTKSGVECRYTDARASSVDERVGDQAQEQLHQRTGPTQESSLTGTDTNSSSADKSIFLAYDPFSADVKSLHPSIPQIWLLWHTFLQNVDPLYKIFHAPSFERQLLQEVQSFPEINEDVETLLFAVYFAAIVSLVDEECVKKLKGTKMVLLKR